MKKLLVLFLIISAVFTVNAVEVQFGAKAGLSMNSLSFDGVTGEESATVLGFQFGGFAEIKLTKEFAIQPELLFTYGKYKYESTSSSDYSDLRDIMIEIPILAKYSIALQGGKFVSIFAGPSLAFSLGKPQQRATSGGTTGDWEDATWMEKGNISLVFGGSFEISKIIFDLRYCLGLKDKTESDSNKVKLNSLIFSVGYKF